MTGDQRSGDSRDVFISYAHADGEWVKTLAENLHRAGLKVFYDQWDIGLGDVVVHKIDHGILNSRNGILVVSPTSLTRPYVQNEYAALMDRAIMRGQLLIPVLLKDAEMPPLLATRLYADFRNAEGPGYQTAFDKLVRALKGERPGPPAILPPGGGYKVAGTNPLRLSITPQRTILSGDGIDISDPPPAAGFDFDDLLWRLKRAQTHWGPQRDAAGASAGRDGLESVLYEIGGKLADSFLPPAVTAALIQAIAEAERLNGTLQLGLDIAEPLAGLPWETLRLGSTVLALNRHVELFRRIDTQGPAPAITIPGPLRILVAIGSPDAQNARGELLDMEAELQRILDATDKPHRAGNAAVHILEHGSIAAIHDALTTGHFHVLHISCHAAPGTLILETPDGAEDRVTAQRLCEEAIPAERAAPLVVLAGCSTGQDGKPKDDADSAELPGLARMLVQHGVPAVIAMQASVGDHYATDLMGEVYQALSTWEDPRPLAALGHARRTIERKRITAIASQPPPEWPTAAFFCAVSPTALFDPAAKPETLEEVPPPTLDPGVVVRRIGDMVGRRCEQRLILRALRDPDDAGVLIHGIGGVGKSTLAAHILHRLATSDGFLLISLKGETDPDRVLGAIGQRLFQIGLDQGENESGTLRRLAGVLRDPQHSWRDRFDYLSNSLLSRLPVAFLFDNFEDNLTGRAVPDEAAELLARWLQTPHLSRLVFTSRHTFELPDDPLEQLTKFHLGPLSWAETRKLFWRLDGLKALSADDQRHAYESVGGHPRALEYLDALLRGGKARFPDVQAKLRKQLKAKGIADPARWYSDTTGGLDAALADTVMLAADDVLLDQLLAQLADDPLARRLLIGAAVYRVAVDELGLVWAVGDPVERAPDPERATRLQAAEDRWKEARKKNPAADWPDVVWPDGELEQFQRDLAVEREPPVAMPAGFALAKQRLLDLSLLAPVCFADTDERMFLVHRWTAAALEKRANINERSDAHQSAAAYWRWRVTNTPQSRERDIADLLEARHHLQELGDIEAVHAISSEVILQLDTWGAWEWEVRLLRETLSWMPVGSKEAAAAFHHLGMVAQRQGDYGAALDWYRQSLAISEQLGNRAGMAYSYHQLGMVAQLQGDYEAALDWYRQSLAIEEQLGNRTGMASSYHNMGAVVQVRGDYKAALDWYRQALAIKEQLGNRAGMASSYHQLGNVAQLQSDYEAALDWYRQALAINEQLGNRADMASSYHQLGMIAQVRGDCEAALDWYRQALAINEQLGNRAGMASSYHQLGMIAQGKDDYEAALDWYRQSLAIEEQLGNRAGMAMTLGQIGNLHTERGQASNAVPFSLQSLGLHLQMKEPEVRIDLHWLSHQRQELGSNKFSAIVAEHSDAESAAYVVTLLDEFERQAALHGDDDELSTM
ncbi:tetratricopeptide repeat protein [Skermanella aerolata]|uniref:tetratricopeptide repeat protein n=1 Tax=Skermanella aerolata TaxID=393310 RepID=UPI000A489888|nr:tetratricopeptide repeat protein [Skermanella aerolata]